VGREPLEFRGEGLFREFDGRLKPLTDPGLFLLEDIGMQAHEVLRPLDRHDAPLHVEQAIERGGVVARVKECAESAFCF
jgi:hypothetical protein